MRVLVAGVVVFQILILFAMADPKPVSIDSLIPRLGHGGATVRMFVRTPYHERNRLLWVGIDDPGGFGRNWPEEMDCEPEVEGDDRVRGDCPEVRTVEFENVPAGHYVVVAELRRSDNTQYVAQDTVCLSGPDVRCGGGE